MDKKTSKILLFALFVVCLFAGIPEAVAQCPMCRMAAESNLENGGTAGKGLNTGILLLLLMPYLIVGSLAYIWWRGKKGAEREAEELEQNAVIDAVLDQSSISR